MKTVVIDGAQVKDEASFHELFQRTFGFPGFYGRNFSAWIDCMTCIDDPQAGMSSIHVALGEVLILAVDNGSEFKKQCPSVWEAFLECAAFVNWRRIEHGDSAVLVVSAYA